MAVQGSNTFEWESCTKVIELSDGRVVHQPAVRVRQKDVVISLLGIELGAWSAWKWIDDAPVYRLPDGTLCDDQGTPL